MVAASLDVTVGLLVKIILQRDLGTVSRTVTSGRSNSIIRKLIPTMTMIFIQIYRVVCRKIHHVSTDLKLLLVL